MQCKHLNSCSISPDLNFLTMRNFLGDFELTKTLLPSLHYGSTIHTFCSFTFGFWTTPSDVLVLLPLTFCLEISANIAQETIHCGSQPGFPTCLHNIFKHTDKLLKSTVVSTELQNQEVSFFLPSVTQRQNASVSQKE